MQTEISNVVPAESPAAQFALQLLNELLASGDARSSVWNAQVELLSDFVEEGGRQTSREQLADVHKHLAAVRARPRHPRPLPGTLFVPMS